MISNSRVRKHQQSFLFVLADFWKHDRSRPRLLSALKVTEKKLKNLKFTECRVGGDLVEKQHFIKNSLPISSSHDSAKSLESIERNSQITLLVPSNTRHCSHRRGQAWTICTWSMNAHFCTFCHKHFAHFSRKKFFYFYVFEYRIKD